MSEKKTGPGKGPTNVSGARGASPVLRVRVPPALMERAETLADAAGRECGGLGARADRARAEVKHNT